jgi:uncharacterized protein (DUF1501 family)
MLSRRRFLRDSALMMGAASLAPMAAMAADKSGYKALVCVFLYGGCDSHDILIGHDQPSYDGWSEGRASILERFQSDGNAAARARENLLLLNPTNASRFGSRAFAMPPEMAPMKALFDSGDMAFVPNVGPLIEPANRQTVQDKTVLLPRKLQSHNDQQSTWQAFSGEGAQLGWGGLVLDAMADSSPYTAVSASGQTVFLAGRETRHLQVPGNGKIKKVYGSGDKVFGREDLAQKLQSYYRSAADGAANPMMRDVIRAQARAIDDTEVLSEVLAAQTIGDTIAIDGNRLSSQLATIANMIGARSSFGANRQIFFAGMGGFDTHANHSTSMPKLLGELSEAIASFQSGMAAAGLADEVTLFTASDFGRTLTANASGTDHGWGAHHMVVGGAVRGGQIVGDVPPFESGHDQDFKRGAMIPTIAVDQYGADLGRWFGLSESELDAVFVNRGRFSRTSLGLF